MFVDGAILNLDRLASVMVGNEAVLYFATKGNVVKSINEPRANFDTNLIGTLNCLEATKSNKVKSILHLRVEHHSKQFLGGFPLT